jgi:hypothetical protein
MDHWIDGSLKRRNKVFVIKLVFLSVGLNPADAVYPFVA